LGGGDGKLTHHFARKEILAQNTLRTSETEKEEDMGMEANCSGWE